MRVLHIMFEPVAGESFGRIIRTRYGPEQTAALDLAQPEWRGGFVVSLPAETPVQDCYVPDVARPTFLEERPELGVEIDPVAEGGSLLIQGLPEGSTWEVWDRTDPALPPARAAEGVVDAGGVLEEPMEDAGVYELRIFPPFPWLRFSQQFEVADGP